MGLFGKGSEKSLRLRKKGYKKLEEDMGASHSHPVFLALQELLLSKNLKLKSSTIENFVKECDAVAPWFVVSGSLTIPS